ncbi:MAG: O-antigen ligase family protein [Rhodospirillales bacterium]|nr:O-antigen ligase family protein [Rhodospirillales bacterium]
MTASVAPIPDDAQRRGSARASPATWSDAVWTLPDTLPPHAAEPDTAPRAAPVIGTNIVVIAALLHAAGAVTAALDIVALGSALGTPLWLAIYAWSAATLIRHQGIQWMAWLLRYRPLLVAVTAGAAASYLWSIDPSLTLQRSVHLVGTSLLAIAVGIHLSTRALVTVLTWTFAILLLGGIVASVAAPEVGLQITDGGHAWKGLQNDKNGFGFTAASAALFFIVRVLAEDVRQRAWSLCLGLLATAALIMSDSATSIVACAVGAIVILMFGASTLVRLHGVVALCVLIVGAVFAYALVTLVDAGAVFDVLGRSLDFTGRSEIWDAAWALTERRPWLGFGYGAVWFPRPEMVDAQAALLGTTWSAAHAHNGFLQVASELGLPAAAAAVAVVLRLLIEPIRLYFRRPSPLVLFVIGLQVAFAVSNMSEARLFIDRSFHWIMAVALSIALLRSAQRLGWLSGAAQPVRPSFR